MRRENSNSNSKTIPVNIVVTSLGKEPKIKNNPPFYI